MLGRGAGVLVVASALAMREGSRDRPDTSAPRADTEAHTRRLVRQLEKLGHKVTLTSLPHHSGQHRSLPDERARRAPPGAGPLAASLLTTQVILVSDRTFVQAGPADCPTPDFPASSATLYADGSVTCSGADDTTQPTGTVSFEPTQDVVSFAIELTGLEPGVAGRGSGAPEVPEAVWAAKLPA